MSLRDASTGARTDIDFLKRLEARPDRLGRARWSSASSRCSPSGLNLGIDFEGGIVVGGPGPGRLGRATPATRSTGVGEGSAKIQIVGRRQRPRCRAPGRVDRAARPRCRQTLAELGRGRPSSDVSVTTVGPSWGERDHRSGRPALVVFFIAHPALHHASGSSGRWRSAPSWPWSTTSSSASACTRSSSSRSRRRTVIAFLTILGYSIYDTIVVFDKVQENERRVGVSEPHAPTAT